MTDTATETVVLIVDPGNLASRVPALAVSAPLGELQQIARILSAPDDETAQRCLLDRVPDWAEAWDGNKRCRRCHGRLVVVQNYAGQLERGICSECGWPDGAELTEEVW